MIKTQRILMLLLLVYALRRLPSGSAQKTSELPHIACPNYFEYLSAAGTGPYIGRVTLFNLAKGTTQLKVQLLQREPISSTDNYGLSLFFSNISTVNSIKSGSPVYYRIDFPDPKVPPKLININVNGLNICAEIDYPTTDTRALNLEHTLNYAKLLHDNPLPSPRHRTRMRFKRHKPTTTVIPPFEITTQLENVNPTCGREGRNTVIQPFAYRGNNTQRGQFPWITPIFKKLFEELEFLCGGSLISTRTVVSAAHCFRYSDTLEAHQIVVFLGRYNLENDKENFEKRNLETLHIHPEYDPALFSDADIAILQLISPVELTEFIQPICLWSESSDISLIVGEQGVVVGWGSDESGRKLTNVPIMVNTGIVNETTCRKSKPLFSMITSSRTFCAGNRDGSGPCTGDSGSGLMIKRNGYWMLRGIVSAGLTKEWACQLEDYVVYCDLAKHLQWIKEIAFSTTTTIVAGDAPTNRQQPISERQKVNAICGREATISGVSTQLSVDSGNATLVMRGQFAWLTAIYHKLSPHRQEFLCAGSLISSRVVVTAAHCFRYPPPIEANGAVVYLGRYNLNEYVENYETRDIKTLHIHPEYNPNLIADANIALLELKSPVSFNKFIQPICLWTAPTDDDIRFRNETATIVGWDYNGDYNADAVSILPELVNITIISNELCHTLNASLSQVTSARSLCGYNPNGTTFLISGYGLMIKRDGRWLLRGILSDGDRRSLSLYADLAKHMQWVQNIAFPL